jgi:hypothetical protein
MKPDANTTSTERSQAILVAMQEEMRRVVLGEMRPADQLAALVGRGTDEIRQDLDQRAADGRIFSVRHEGVDYFALFALNPAEGYRPYPAVGGDHPDFEPRLYSRKLMGPGLLVSWLEQLSG